MTAPRGRVGCAAAGRLRRRACVGWRSRSAGCGGGGGDSRAGPGAPPRRLRGAVASRGTRPSSGGAPSRRASACSSSEPRRAVGGPVSTGFAPSSGSRAATVVVERTGVAGCESHLPRRRTPRRPRLRPHRRGRGERPVVRAVGRPALLAVTFATRGSTSSAATPTEIASGFGWIEPTRACAGSSLATGRHAEVEESQRASRCGSRRPMSTPPTRARRSPSPSTARDGKEVRPLPASRARRGLRTRFVAVRLDPCPMWKDQGA